MKRYLSVLLLLSAPLLSYGQAGPNHKENGLRLTPENIPAIVKALSLEQKAKLVTGLGMTFHLPPTMNPKKLDSVLGFRLPPSSPDAAKIPEKVPGAAGRTHPFPEFGIPMLTVSDGPAGLRIDPVRKGDRTKTYYATAFPVATLLASTWDTALVRKVGRAFGSEVHDYGVDILLGPAMNIQRNPLGGRNFEYYSEDPVITGNIAAAMVNGIQSEGVGTSIKHFAANNQETSRNSINERISERALREIYLKGFEIAVRKSRPWTVMSAYNQINGVYASQSKDLLTTILRDEWGFKGLVMSDWFGGKDAVAQMEAGNDLLMPGTPLQADSIIAAVKDGRLEEKVLDRNVERVLRLAVKSPAFKNYRYSDHPDLKKDAEVSRTAAAQGMVLLKNDGNTLPFKQVKSIAAFGNTAYLLIAGGTGSGDVNKAYTITLASGLGNAGYIPDRQLLQQYEKYIPEALAKRPRPRMFFMTPPPLPEMTISPEQLEEEASKDDIALIAIGRNAGEGNDRKLKGDYYLSGEEKNLIARVSDAFHAKGKKVVVVLNIGGVIEVASWRDEADAILLAWQPGQEGGNAMADVLSGKVDPSGKLAVTFPMKYEDDPSAAGFPGTPADKPEETTYKEGVYVGYRYYSSFGIRPAYPFGYGLSYTKFRYGPIKLSSTRFSGKITVTETVTNTGKTAGKEVVEVYVSAPHKEIDKPALELKAFGKTELLQPGQSQTLRFTLTAGDLASFYTGRSSWIAGAGKYTVKTGASSEDIRQEASFDIPKDIVAEKDHPALVPQQPVEELKPESR